MTSPPQAAPEPPRPTPDLVIAGAARSGTSFLAAQLGAHSQIDPGSVKEPNYFSRHLDRGQLWYESLFEPRAADVLRMDASVSYTYPQFAPALPALAAASPGAWIVYVVREPLPRAVSHYLYYKHYFKQETAPTFGAALSTNPLYAGASDYHRWLPLIAAHFPPERVLVVPFKAVADGGVAAAVCAWLGLSALPTETEAAAAHQNNVVAFRHESLRVASRTLRRSRLYPMVRERLGADRLRRVRLLVTRQATLPTTAEELATCTAAQQAELADLDARARQAVREYLSAQDARTGLEWSGFWQPQA